MTLVAAAVAAAADNRRCSNLPAPMNETRPTRISQRRHSKSPLECQRIISGQTTPFVGSAANVTGAARPATNYIYNDHPLSIIRSHKMPREQTNYIILIAQRRLCIEN